jgi:hypothetical protein
VAAGGQSARRLEKVNALPADPGIGPIGQEGDPQGTTPSRTARMGRLEDVGC